MPKHGTRTARKSESRTKPAGPRPLPPAETPRPATEPKDIAAASDDDFAIVAVGASAGGLEAFSDVLERMRPASNLAFVVVQHLSPQHSSSLTELLAARTPLKVTTATSGMQLEPGHVYVMPPNVQMDVIDGRLHLGPRPTDRSQFTPIDYFMQSLARWAQDRTIGVILSGTASDGAAGIREIKTLGGITIVQKPETSKYDGMPRAAISTGMVDLVLSPAEIAEHLNQMPRHPYLRRATPDALNSPELSINDGQLRDLFNALRRASGIDFKQYKPPTVKRRLLRRMALLRLMDTDAYLRYVTETPSEAKALSQDLLIHVTRFFRDPDSFAVISEHVLPEILHERGDEPVRMWVPGCATGEEAYSLGICLLEALGDRATERRIQIFATDVSDAAIDHARSGTYPMSIAADVSADRLKRFFTKSDGGYRVVKALRDMCVFARHDLTRDPPFSRLDFVICRNVLIYLDVSLQKRLVTIFHYALRSGGFLMLGPAETPGAQSFFSVVDKKWRLFRKSPAEMTLPLALPTDLLGGPHTVLSTGRGKVPLEGKTVQDEATRVILDRFGPPGVVVDANLQIVQFRGHTGPYLEAAAGEPNLSVLKMARGGLLHPLRSALQLAKRRSRLVHKDHIQVQRNGDWIEVRLEVVPLTTSRGEHYLILFNEHTGARAKGKKPPAVRAAAVSQRDADGRVADLRRELAASREYLQSIIQELEAANEELQSANEEILSSNEELQSTNEELNTVNEELHSRNEELTRVNSDLTNLLSSVDIPIVIVGSDLGIRRFTPRAEQLFNLIAGDVGRPIGQIKPNFACDDLEGLIRETIDSIAPREREVQDKGSRWLSLRVRPYKGIDNRLDGAVVSVIDIDATKRHQAFVEDSRDHFRAIVNAIQRPLLVVDARGRIRTANREFRDRYSLGGAEVEGQELSSLGLDGKGRPLTGLVDDVMRQGRTVARTWTSATDGDSRTVRATGDPIPLGEGQHGVLISLEDGGRDGGEA